MVDDRRFRERRVPPWWWHPAFFAWCAVLVEVLGVTETWAATSVYALALTAFVAVGACSQVVEIRDGAIHAGRGHRVPTTAIVGYEVLRGPAARDARRRTIPQQRRAAVWNRTLVRLEVDEGLGRTEHLYGVRDVEGFLRAVGADPANTSRRHHPSGS